jgi:prepilin-type N-terminal cleavage/methylation domain-containing protein
MSHLSLRRARGFTLIETMVAITILSIGLLSMAALLARTTAMSNTSRYMSTQSLLASEKLDDLNRLSASDPDIAVPNGVSVGSLTANVSQNGIDYFDQIQISNGNGGMTETSTSTNAAGATVYDTTTHSPNGQVTQVTNSPTPPAVTASTVTFTRRWVIEQDVPIPGVRRITVLVTVQTSPPAAPFQMSMVRP